MTDLPGLAWHGQFDGLVRSFCVARSITPLDLLVSAIAKPTLFVGCLFMPGELTVY